MDKDEQARFVTELLENVKKGVLQQIFDGKLPEEWDGFELRWLLAHRFEEATLGTRGRKYGYYKRYRDFMNTVRISNL